MATAAVASTTAIPNREWCDSKSPPGEWRNSKSLRGGGRATVADGHNLLGVSAAAIAGAGGDNNDGRRGGTLMGKGQ